MKAPYPFGYIGDGITRCVVLALPVWKVQRLLPPNLELGDQDVSVPGTHPVILQFHDFSQCRFSIPSLLPPLNFHEQTFGVPFTHISSRSGLATARVPYYFMPRLYLDDLWVWSVGRNLWGFDKQMAAIEVTSDRYLVRSFSGGKLASLSWSYGDESARPTFTEDTTFKLVRRMLSQALVSLAPAAIGPIFTLTDFDRNWDGASARRIRGVLEVDPCYAPGFDGWGFVTDDKPADPQCSMIACYEISTPWWLSFSYLPRLDPSHPALRCMV